MYVGKARSLRKRLASYWGKPLHPRTAAMMEAAQSVEWMLASGEVDALMLEYNLIQRHRPRFNIRYRDDKSYPFLALTVGETWPRAQVMRGAKRKNVRYFGPYRQREIRIRLVVAVADVEPGSVALDQVVLEHQCVDLARCHDPFDGSAACTIASVRGCSGLPQ